MSKAVLTSPCRAARTYQKGWQWLFADAAIASKAGLPASGHFGVQRPIRPRPQGNQ